jgi:hypothetical protein
MTTLDIVLAILILAWIGGYGFNIAGSLIHILLVVALVVLTFRLLGLSTRR